VSAVALATAAVARGLDEDMAPLVGALARRGIDGRVVDWDDPAADWASFGLVVVRSAWDYTRRPDEFLAWAERVAGLTRLANPPAALRWSGDKRYLADLVRAAVPVVPTAFAAPGEPMEWPDAAEVVVKPAVSAGSLDTARYPAARLADAHAHVDRLHAEGRVAMAQPYLAAVEGTGETAVVHLDGALSHVVRKGPMLVPGLATVAGLFVEEDIRPAEATEAELAVAERALAAAPAGEPLLYGRVDLLPGEHGEPVVLEVELVEPSLFLAHDPAAAGRLAAAIGARLNGAPSAPG